MCIFHTQSQLSPAAFCFFFEFLLPRTTPPDSFSTSCWGEMTPPQSAGDWNHNQLLIFRAETESSCSLDFIQRYAISLYSSGGLFYSFAQEEQRQRGGSTICVLELSYQHQPCEGGEKFWKARWRGRTRSVLVHQKGQMSDCFKSFPTGAEILIFAAQEHYQYPQREAVIIINESHFQTNALAVQSACDLQSKAKQSKGSQQTRNEQSVSILLLQSELISLICLPRWLCSRWLIHEHVENGASPEDATLLFE